MSERLNTQDLIDLLVNRQGLDRKQAENFVKEFFSLIEEGLEKDKVVKIKGLGTFKLIDVESRESVNVNTGERIEIQGHTKISFTPDTALRDVINKPFAHFETVVLNENTVFDDTAEDEIQDPEPITTPDPTDEKEENETTQEENKDFNDVENTQTVEETEIVETPQPTIPKKKAEKGSSNNKILILVIVLTTLLCGILLFFTYYSDIFPEKKKSTPIATAPAVTEDKAITDSTTVTATDSIDESVAVPEKPKTDKPTTKPSSNSNIGKNTAIPFSKIPVNADSTSYEIIGTKTTHTIKEGETLIRISYRYYGTKDLWPYLVMHNRATIKDANAVPFGTKINIPELKKK